MGKCNHYLWSMTVYPSIAKCNGCGETVDLYHLWRHQTTAKEAEKKPEGITVNFSPNITIHGNARAEEVAKLVHDKLLEHLKTLL